MSSSSKTANLRLNQWVRSDFISMDDFNADNARLEAAVGSLPLVKLHDQTLTAQASTISVSLTASILAGVIRLEVYILGSGYSSSSLRVNNISAANYETYTHSGNWNSSNLTYFDMGGNYGTLHMLRTNKIYYSGADYSYQCIAVVPTALTRLTFYNYGNNPFPVGTHCLVYAFRP